MSDKTYPTKASAGLRIKTQQVTYNSLELGTQVTHSVLIAQQKNKQILLSNPNLFLYKHTRSSMASSTRHAPPYFYVLPVLIDTAENEERRSGSIPCLGGQQRHLPMAGTTAA
ncbi:hypothetical protein I7860_02345 [Pseudomonas tolaasii]|uniref:hypothetical protein n=1 Tax=Pseudomonas tolaasii TaxID=29442 RepID=UPI001C56770C|nr:hypothetical protein [Pseudomonas tolaasii]MBW1245512.1 hypothetical protein [Pseudomonas tolaasii]